MLVAGSNKVNVNGSVCRRERPRQLNQEFLIFRLTNPTDACEVQARLGVRRSRGGGPAREGGEMNDGGERRWHQGDGSPGLVVPAVDCVVGVANDSCSDGLEESEHRRAGRKLRRDLMGQPDMGGLGQSGEKVPEAGDCGVGEDQPNVAADPSLVKDGCADLSEPLSQRIGRSGEGLACHHPGKKHSDGWDALLLQEPYKGALSGNHHHGLDALLSQGERLCIEGELGSSKVG